MDADISARPAGVPKSILSIPAALAVKSPFRLSKFSDIPHVNFGSVGSVGICIVYSYSPVCSTSAHDTAPVLTGSDGQP